MISLAAVGACSKPNCSHRAPLNRHHRAHEALWLSCWASARASDPRFQALVKRYWEFREEDVVLICLPHHAEIHSIYDAIVEEDRARTGTPLYLYSWTQQRRLSQLLRDACSVWLATASPGLDSEIYEATKKLRRGLLRKRFKRLNPQRPEVAAENRRRAKKLRVSKKRRRRRRRA